ncbi:MAG: hypothetical protein E7406_07120 [Ruminococcaceae bacterium]|nr:hypothetical protein [Oscillospiraceae bacterium]
MAIRYQVMRFPNGKGKAVTFSYDDGQRTDLRLADTLTRYGLKGTFNLNGGEGEFGKHITPDEVKEHMLEKGHEIAVHGACHRAPGRHRPVQGIKDILDCRLHLEETYDTIIRGMAYPDSGIRRIAGFTSYETIKDYLTDLDIAYSRSLGEDNDLFELPSDWHNWIPTAHHSNPEIFNYIEKFLKANVFEGYVSRRDSLLFYVWGHAFEFDRNDNWDLLDKICEKISGHDEIWYATNIEIYDYVTAYNSLRYSADASRIYNPTLYTIWFEVNKKIYSIKPGETLKIPME